MELYKKLDLVGKENAELLQKVLSKRLYNTNKIYPLSSTLLFNTYYTSLKGGDRWQVEGKREKLNKISLSQKHKAIMLIII